MKVPSLSLGATDITVSRLALGTVKFGRDKGVKYPYPVKIPTDQEALNLLAHAAELGINLIDTAPAYGNSEERLGSLLGGQRDKWVICTKVGERFDGQTSSYDFTPEAVQESVEQSLRHLNTDVLDLVLIHSDGRDDEIINTMGTLEALSLLKADGKVRAIGISHKTASGAELAIAKGVDVLMATLNPNYTDELGVIAQAETAGIGVLIKKAFGSGHGSVADLAWVARQQGVSSIVVGTTNPSHLTDNATALTN